MTEKVKVELRELLGFAQPQPSSLPNLTGCRKTRLPPTSRLKCPTHYERYHAVRMLKKAFFLTRPTPARQDAPFRGQGRNERRGEAYASVR